MGVSEQDAAIQDSQGPIQDRTREHLGPTDVGIVEFRKLRHGRGAGAASRASAPKAAQAAKQYAVRAGGWIAGPDKDLATVMTERFGHRHGYVGRRIRAWGIVRPQRRPALSSPLIGLRGLP